MIIFFIKLIFAVIDLYLKSHGPFYEVPTGRRDGRVSNISFAANLPDVDDSIELLKSKFKEKGLSDKDLVLLSGGNIYCPLHQLNAKFSYRHLQKVLTYIKMPPCFFMLLT